MIKTNFYLVLLGLSKLQKNISKICEEQKIKLIVFDKKPNLKKKNQHKADNTNFLELKKKLKELKLYEILKKNTSIAYCGSEFGLETAYKLNKLDYRKYISINRKFFRKDEEETLVGSIKNTSFLKKKFNFKFKIYREKLIKKIYKSL